ncbi:MAG: Lrp/AsnC family transcriptional regulator [Thermanaeromonas sp.]|uniref:Lrp/AsnC family transcriptional regulator n=1 Tax=Thermanaeromonas sp. TaxID=2003697 RepID=UPI0024390DFC|nr:Lrp/AsnC family transcriptional regulator [Thermanaeromonas sp.]MCG0277440.1 Lrp/AsnC family transcriptional regulator [Thermanaeromonas sp.]
MLTKRRLQFLNKIKALYEESAAPVHYATVAEKLKVSKWTAYDLLRELEKDGFLKREYVVNATEKLPGRSMIMFVPTAKAYQMEGEEGEEGSLLYWYRDWQELKERLLKIFAGLSPQEAKAAVTQLLQEIKGKEHPVILATYTLTVLLLSLKSFGEKGLNLMRAALQRLTVPEMGLVLATGTGLGLAAHASSQHPFTAQVERLLHRFYEQLDKFTHREKKLLSDFLKEALEHSLGLR